MDNKNKLNFTDEAATKSNQIKIISDVTQDILSDIETLAFKFDQNRDRESAHWLAYETSRVVERLSVLNYMTRDLAVEIEERANGDSDE